MAKKWPGMVVQRTFIKGHSFVYRLYKGLKKKLPWMRIHALLCQIGCSKGTSFLETIFIFVFYLEKMHDITVYPSVAYKVCIQTNVPL